ncbi:MAG: Hint domain-containing protein [Acidiphilium sp.]|nr:Hint domain-containing protein [Acidiphilium sp.]MDD4935478.1 Hint domain-containing protein [Acidiphilium sp.]
MSSALQIFGPAVINLLNGVALTSLDALPPGGITLTDSNAATTLTVTLVSGDNLSASSAGGATVVNGIGALTLTGDLAAINAALASLMLASTIAGTTTLSIIASDGSSTATTALAVDTLPDQPPAFVTPPASLMLAAGVASPIGLHLADDPAKALGRLGTAPETIAITLQASSGVLLLDPAAAPGIGIAGDATGAITLSATSTEFAVLNAALGAITLDAATAGSLLYVASQTSGPLPIADTSGSLTYTTSGSISANAEFSAGAPVVWQSAAAWSGGFAPGLGTDVTIGNGATGLGYGVAAALTIAAGASVDLEASISVGAALLNPASTLVLGNAALSIGGGLTISDATLLVGADATLAAGGVTIGTASALIDFGSMTLNGLDALGSAMLPGGAVLEGPVGVASGGMIDFAGLLQADQLATATGIIGVSLFANATIEGAGTLVAGNFSESDNIAGPGTVLALGPAPLEILAGRVGGGAHFAIDPGAVLEFGAISPLYGVFAATPITIGSDATISFTSGASGGQDGATYASTLGEQGGVLVLDNPESFAGTILGFLPGDRIVLSTLVSLASPFNISTSSFEVEGDNSTNTTQSEIITIHASLATGMTPVIETDAAGNQVIGLRPATASLTLNDTIASHAAINAVTGIATPIEGLGLLVPSNGKTGLVLTIAASHGGLSDGGAVTTALTLSAANALTMNADLAALSYTAPSSGSGDVLNFTGGTGLAGVTAAIGVAITAPATLDYTGGTSGIFNANLSWQGGLAPSGGDIAAFPSHNGAPLMVTGPGAAGEISLGGAYDFAGSFDLGGAAGLALDVGGGGFALFDANAVVTLGAATQVGDTHGAGTLGIAGTVFAPGNVAIGGVASAGGSLLDITGSLLLGQTLAVGAASTATFDITGDAGFSTATLGNSVNGDTGLIRASGNATLSFGTLDIISGTLSLAGNALANAAAATLIGGLIDLAGETRFDTPYGLDLAGGTLSIGSEAVQVLAPGTLTLGAAATLDLAGSLTAAALNAAGNATIAGEALIGTAVSLTNGATLDLAAGTLAAGSLTIASGATLIGSGAIGAATSGVTLIPIDASGLIEATGGTLTIGGNLAGNATIAANATLDLVGSAAGGTISFAGADAMLIVNDSSAMQNAVANFAASDAIDLIGVAPSLVSVAGNVVSIADPSEFALNEATGAAAATVASDGVGGTYITAGGAMPCFTRGTNLLTPNGYRSVETLIPGDALVSFDGVARPIRWIGWRIIDLARDPAVALLRPVVIAPGAFGPGRPRRALAVSPLHAIFGAGKLVPAVLLVNGATITRDVTGFAVTYYHVELDRHAIVFADGLPTETYRDNGNRARFLDSLGNPGTPTETCAPLVLGGADLRAAREALHERATALGYQIAHGPLAEALIDPVCGRIKPRLYGKRLMFDLPVPAGRVILHCHTGMATDTDPTSEDRRILGICAGALRADGRSITAWQGAGWHARAAGDVGHWSSECAELHLPRPARQISIEVIGSVPRWVRNAAHLSF